MPRLQLNNADARIVYLALVYHLGRPGSEIDALTLERHALGLGPVHAALQPQLTRAAVELELSEYQLHRLGEALLGIINELKQFEMAHGRSAVPGFAEAVRTAFPEAAEPGAALDLAQHALMLRRRLDRALCGPGAAAAGGSPAAQPQPARRPWWRRWGRATAPDGSKPGRQ